MMLYMNVRRFMLFLVFCIDRIFYIHSSIFIHCRLLMLALLVSDFNFWADLGLKPYFEHENGAVHLVIVSIKVLVPFFAFVLVLLLRIDMCR